MDILHLVDRLEELVNQATTFPLTRKLMIDEERLIDLIDQMRVSIPEEVKRAQRVVAERDRMLAHAQEKAERVQGVAEQKAIELVEEQQIVVQARRRAEEIIREGRLEAEAIRADADEYVVDTLERMEMEVGRVLQQVQNGLLKVKAERDAGRPAMPEVPLEAEEEPEAE